MKRGCRKEFVCREESKQRGENMSFIDHNPAQE